MPALPKYRSRTASLIHKHHGVHSVAHKHSGKMLRSKNVPLRLCSGTSKAPKAFEKAALRCQRVSLV